jgi:hypothetical protein
VHFLNIHLDNARYGGCGELKIERAATGSSDGPSEKQDGHMSSTFKGAMPSPPKALARESILPFREIREIH